MGRRPGRTTLALALPTLAFLLFGMARVVAPVSGLGLLFVRPVELGIAGALAGQTAELSEAEAERLDRLLGVVGERAEIDTDRLIVRVQEDTDVNASAGAAHLLFVTKGALALPDEELEGVLAHELGHHRGLHPVLTAVVWWLRIPGALLAGVYRILRRLVGAIATRLGAVGRVVAIPLLLLIMVWQVTVMWVFYIGELLAMRAARVSEFEA